MMFTDRKKNARLNALNPLTTAGQVATSLQNIAGQVNAVQKLADQIADTLQNIAGQLSSLQNTAVPDADVPENNTTNHSGLSCNNATFCFFSFLAKCFGLYPLRDESSCFCKVLIFLAALTFLFTNILNVLLNTLGIVCQNPGCAHPPSSSTKNNSSDIVQLGPALDNGRYGDFRKIVYFITSLSALLSYVFMLRCLNKHVKTNSNRIAPFSTDNISDLGYFTYVFFANMVFIVISTAILAALLFVRYHRKEHSMDFYLDLFGYLTHSFAWMSTLLSCFIFSKVAYDVAHECKEKMLEIKEAGAHETLDELIGKDENYIQTMKDSIVPFSSWFSIHWISYCITTFLNIAFVIQNVQHDLYTTESSCYEEKGTKCWLELTYHIIYAIGHSILFIYPCFRAATLSKERTKLICKIVKEKSMAVSKRQALVQYLQVRDCSFKVNFLCATATFGANVAYFSIFAGIMSVAMRIAL